MKTIIQAMGVMIVCVSLLGFVLEAAFHLVGALLLVAFWGTLVIGIITVCSYLIHLVSKSHQALEKRQSEVRS